MKRVILLLLLFVCVRTAPVAAQTTASEKNGKAVFDKWCTPCHGSVAPVRSMFGASALPGTAALAVKYKGTVPPVLEQRTNLTPGYIRTVVRTGLYGMPITRKTEISDAELEDVVAYLTRTR